ncbi:MAG: xanthine dehydrogenase family protein molybdopterin-binding subunit [Thermoanaerobaculia bacterium]|nr:xanthine dehydrogenase family protein molybdopterin-binding subunit [Thermoanaerobaculia bacterium]
MVEYTWPPEEKRSILGDRISRLDGPVKVTGAAEYSFDVRRPGMLHGKILRCPHAHARITRLDVSAAREMPGVRAVRVIQDEGSEIRWALDEVVSVAADTEELARDAVRAVEIEYEVLPHFVDGENKDEAFESSPAGSRTEGDPDAAFEAAVHRHRGYYGLPSVSHNCLEAHGQVCEWNGDRLTVWASTQVVSSMPNQYADALEIPASNVRVISQHIGGGFGSKFSADRWGIECARLARETNRPVKLMLEREPELTVAGDRPSSYAEVEVAADGDGKLVAWRSSSWGSGGLAGSRGAPPLPYVFEVPNRRIDHLSVVTNVASARAWRAPNHPQGCFITLSALEDLAAEMDVDPYDLLWDNLDLTGRLEPIYRDELPIAEELMGWKKRWTPRGEGGKGPIKRGLGLGVHTWGGRGHRSNCQVTIHPDGVAEARLASQDIGTGTRTVIAIALAETLGLPLSKVRVSIGDSVYPASGGSGGSTTVGGVSSSTRRAAVNVREQLFQEVAPHLEAEPEELELAEGTVRVRAEPDRSITWEEAIGFLAGHPVTNIPLSASGSNPGPGQLTDSGVGGVQMAEVRVDTETGIVRVEKMVAVQDCGLVVDEKTAISQVHGGLIMGISYALSEEKILDPVTGRMLNTDFESYKIAGYGEVGELVVHMMTGEGYDERGVIGLGEPPVISPGAAISNAVANAIGVRVPYLPLTPRRILDTLAGRGGRS